MFTTLLAAVGALAALVSSCAIGYYAALARPKLYVFNIAQRLGFWLLVCLAVVFNASTAGLFIRGDVALSELLVGIVLVGSTIWFSRRRANSDCDAVYDSKWTKWAITVCLFVYGLNVCLMVALMSGLVIYQILMRHNFELLAPRDFFGDLTLMLVFSLNLLIYTTVRYWRHRVNTKK